MAGILGGLVRGISGNVAAGLAGQRQGKVDRVEAERTAAQDELERQGMILQQSLLGFNLDEARLNAPIVRQRNQTGLESDQFNLTRNRDRAPREDELLDLNITGARQGVESFQTPEQRAAAQRELQRFGTDEQIRGFNATTGALGRERITQGTGGGNIPASAAAALAKQGQQIANIDNALRLVEQRPQAFGIQNALREAPLGLGTVIANQQDQGDQLAVQARAMVGNIGSLIIHDRSGAAVTASEFPRLRPFIPLLTDPPEAVATKLRQMRQIVEEERNLFQQTLGRGAVASPAGAPGTGFPTPQGAPANPPSADEQVGVGVDLRKAQRWEDLVAAGTSPEAATAQVNREFP